MLLESPTAVAVVAVVLFTGGHYTLTYVATYMAIYSQLLPTGQYNQISYNNNNNNNNNSCRTH